MGAGSSNDLSNKELEKGGRDVASWRGRVSARVWLLLLPVPEEIESF